MTQTCISFSTSKLKDFYTLLPSPQVFSTYTFQISPLGGFLFSVLIPKHQTFLESSIQMEDPVTEGPGLLPPLNPTAQEEEENKSEFHSNQETQEEKEEEGTGGGGLIRSLMSTMATPLGTKTGEPETEDKTRSEVPKKEVEEGGDIGGGGEAEGGILNNIISTLFHQNDDEEQGKKMEGDEEKNEQVKAEEESDGVVIENIVSHLPPSIPVPTADEATILINSLVRD